MYTREILPPRETPIKDGRPLAGTWTKAFSEVDLLNIRKPYVIPTPWWLRDHRIKEWESFLIQDDHYYLDALFCNLKLYRIVKIFLYNKDTKEQISFRKKIPFRGWHLPRQLANSSIDHRSNGFFFRIHNWLTADLIRLDLDIAASRKRPSFTAHLEYDMAGSVEPMVVSLLFSDNRSMYAYKAMGAVRGDMVAGGRHIVFDPARTSGIVCDFKGFYPYRMRSIWCSSLGFDTDNRRYGFNLGENQTRETYKNNENALWVEGRLTPLPPVRITCLEGPEAEWIIQDTEGMVDLSFTPVLPVKNSLNLVLIRTEQYTYLGLFNGFLLNSKGEQIQVRNLWGFGEIFSVRV
jgi:hypothetical protein